MKADGKLIGLSSVGSFDSDIYGATKQARFEGYLASIPATEEEEKEEEEKEVRRKLPTYTGPEKFKLIGDEDEQEDPFKQYKRPTIADRESEYQARARSRRTLSPERVDGFGKGRIEGARSYKEIMMEQQLLREEAEVKHQLSRKKQEEESKKKNEERRKKLIEEQKKTVEKRKREVEGKSRGKRSSKKAKVAEFEEAWKQDPEEEVPEIIKEKPNFNQSGLLTKEQRTFKGVELKYLEPNDSSKPRTKWRLYPFKESQSFEPYKIYKKSSYLLGRDTKVCDIILANPSCSKQHAVIQYRSVQKEDGQKVTRPYIMDLGSTNGSYLNGSKLDDHRYIQLIERDIITFGYSKKEYVLIPEELLQTEKKSG
eukprot:TRINITY_DN6783_c0_g1_i1.p1 TRINITY_DN6783_c0_g1~~TRINITY_DN6783_c0_g1_i1.p1  ORF type:complete len:369 (-),score=104.23 TRINITY_DN6783_c0_g1_i1:27-1133(-)